MSSQLKYSESRFFSQIDPRTELRVGRLPLIDARTFEQITADGLLFREFDPASRDYNLSQIYTIRSGMVAVLAHRFFSRVLEEISDDDVLYQVERMARRVQILTGVEIHPQARLGTMALDHGRGTVIGATVEAGENLRLYHGVTLGSTGKDINGRRHPRLGSEVFLANNSQVLGPSVIGDRVKISSGAKVIDSIIGHGARVGPGVVIQRRHVPAGTRVNTWWESWLLPKVNIVAEITDKNSDEIETLLSFKQKFKSLLLNAILPRHSRSRTN